VLSKVDPLIHYIFVFPTAVNDIFRILSLKFVYNCVLCFSCLDGYLSVFLHILNMELSEEKR